MVSPANEMREHSTIDQPTLESLNNHQILCSSHEEEEATNEFSARPPTPPKQSNRTSIVNAADPKFISNANDHLHDDSIGDSSAGGSSSGKARKQVIWDPLTKYYSPEEVTPSRHFKGESTPLRSILKTSSPFKDMDGLNAKVVVHGFQSMLESSVLALSSPERSTKIDTYITFSNALRAYDGRPDIKAIKSKMPAMSTFIRRDIGAKLSNSSKDTRDSQLIQQALKLLTIFAWSPELVDSINSEDATFFIQDAIRTIQDCQSPKILVTYFLHFLRQQQFPNRIMTSERANAVLTALGNVDYRGSNNICQERISIYCRLLTQSRSTMSMRAADWIDKVLAGLISSNKETRIRAFYCVVESAQTIGSERTVARAVMNVFSRGAAEGQPFFNRFSHQLMDLFKDGEGAYVANVWGAITLLLRARYPVTSWEYFSPWLGTIQLCFNSSTISVKIAANAAWGKLIFALSIGGEAITPKNLDLLTRPLARYLDPSNASLNSKAPRQAAISNVVTLLYYSLRPNISYTRILRLWDALIISLVDRLILCGREEIQEGYEILAALFDGSSHRVWKDCRGLEKRAIAPAELPRLDPKWVRANCSLVLKTVRNALIKATWEDSLDTTERVLWQNFTKTLADAGAKEVKIASDLMDSIAHVLTMLNQIWRTGVTVFPSLRDSTPDAFIRIIGFLLNSTMENIGTVCFTDKQLVCDAQSTYVFAPNSSSKYSFEESGSITLQTPLVHVLHIFLKPPTGITASAEYSNLIHETLGRCVRGLNSRRKRLSLLSSCIPILPVGGIGEIDKTVWNILSSLTIDTLKLEPKGTMVPEAQVQGWEFRDVVIILQWGSRHDVSSWDELLKQLSHVVSSEQNSQIILQYVLDPVADSLRLYRSDMDRLIWFQRGKDIMSQAALAFSSSHIEATPSLRLQQSCVQRMIATDCCANLFAVVNQILLDGHIMLCEDWQNANIMDSLGIVDNMLFHCPIELLLDFICAISEGVSAWIHASFQKTDLADLINTNVSSLWTNIVSKIKLLPKHDSIALQRLTPIICAGFESENKSIVAMTMPIWNETFGLQRTVEYPKRLQEAIDRGHRLECVSLPETQIALGTHFTSQTEFPDVRQAYVGTKDPQTSDWEADKEIQYAPEADHLCSSLSASSSLHSKANAVEQSFLISAEQSEDFPSSDSQVMEGFSVISPHQPLAVPKLMTGSTLHNLMTSSPDDAFMSELAAKDISCEYGKISKDSLQDPSNYYPDQKQHYNYVDSLRANEKHGNPGISGLQRLSGQNSGEPNTTECSLKSNGQPQESPDFENSVREVPDSFAGNLRSDATEETQTSFQIVLKSRQQRKEPISQKDAQPRPGRGRKTKAQHGKSHGSPFKKLDQESSSHQERQYSVDSCESLLDSISVAEPVPSTVKTDIFSGAGSITPSKRELRKRKVPISSPNSAPSDELSSVVHQGMSPKKLKPSVTHTTSTSFLGTGKSSKSSKNSSQRRHTRTNLRIIEPTEADMAMIPESQAGGEKSPSIKKRTPNTIPMGGNSTGDTHSSIGVVTSYNANPPTNDATFPVRPLMRLQQAIQNLEETNLNSYELREAEDMIFDLYSRLRERRRTSESIAR